MDAAREPSESESDPVAAHRPEARGRGWSVRLALAGDTMLGRGVAALLDDDPLAVVVSPDVVEVVGEADLVLLNLECCISERGRRWADPHKPFFFRAPPVAVDTLVGLGTSCVTLANNHALDYGYEALEDTIAYLADAGIACVGAGMDSQTARRPAVLETAGVRVAIAGVTDHPADYAAACGRPGVAHAELQNGLPEWLVQLAGAARHVRVAEAPDARTPGPGAPDAVVVSPHWGPNMVAAPVGHVRRAAAALVDAGATLVAGHSAHVFHGVAGSVLFDLGDFVDDYAVDPVLRNDLGLLFVVTLDASGLRRLEGVPLSLNFCHTRLATGDDAAWIRRRFRAACRALGTEVGEDAGRLVIER